MKNTATVWNQQERIYKLLQITTSAKIKKADPATGGNIHLASNWGNNETQEHINQYHNRGAMLFRLFQKYFDIAFCYDYPEHEHSKRLMKASN